MLTRLVNKFFSIFCLAFFSIALFILNSYAIANKSSELLHHTMLTTFDNTIFFESDTIIINEVIEIPDTLETQTLQPDEIKGSGVILEDIVIYSCVDSIDFDFRLQKVYLYGNADVKYQDIHLVADYVEISFIENELFATGMPDTAGVITGNPVFTEAGKSFQSEELRYNFESKKGWTLNVITEEAEGYLHGETVKIMPDKVVYISEGKFTTCENPEPHFHIGFRRAKVIPKDKIVTSFAYLKVHDVPTPLMVPFGFFPNTAGQASGVLIPTYGEARNRGFFLENGGFYWGINDFVDLAIKGTVYSRGSWGLDIGSRYNVRYKYNGAFNLSHSTTLLGEENLPGFEESKDYRVVWNHSQDPKARPNSVFRANVNAGSSQMNRFNPVSDQDYLSNTLSSNVSYSANWAGKYNFSANLRHSQNTISRTVDLSLPELAFSVNRFYPLRRKTVAGEYKWYENITMNYNMNARNQINTLDSLLFRNESLSQFKNGINHTIPINHSANVLKHFNLSNSINYNERWYFQTIQKSWDYDDLDNYSIVEGDTIYGKVATDTISGFRSARDFSYSTSLSTRIYGLKNFNKGPLRAVRHVMSPSLGFSFRPDFADPFWGYYEAYHDPRFDEPQRYSIFEQGIYGTPPADRSGAINFSIGNNLEIKVRDRKDTISGERKIALIDNFSISTGYDLARDSLNLSDIRMSGRTRIFGNFDITYSSTWTPYAVDDNGRKINQFLWDTEKRLLHLNNTSWNLSFNYTLDSRAGEPGQTPTASGRDGNGFSDQDLGQNGDVFDNEEQYDDINDFNRQLNQGEIDYSIPWSLRFSYTFNYNSRSMMHTGITTRDYIQNLSVSGNIRLTDNWRIGFQSGYDFDNNEITYTSIDIYRDLHCWEMTFNWIPFGFRQSYNFTIRVKAAVLQDLKYTRRTHHLDRYN